ncbi:MAG: translation initiation factor IF-2 subunit beta [Candidatus Micrarchaeales archaeon]
MSDEEYMKLLDRAFEKAPKLAVDVSDFKIPVIDALVQGNKTIIRNLSAIADRARRDPNDIARYMSKELAVPVNIEEGRLIVSGKFRIDELNKRIARYFEVYVICKECHKPDSHLDNAGRGMFYFVCEACGARYGIKSY